MAKRILLADDSLTIQKVVELTFSDADYDLVCVPNGQRALEKVAESAPDLILADVVMPEKNGYEVCEAIKANPATAAIPVILLSGTFEPFDRDRAERLGCDAIVSKPFDSQQLLRQVEALLARAPQDVPSASTLAIALPTPAPPPPPSAPSPERAPAEAGFASEDFTGSIPRPAEIAGGPDLFEEEYGQADVESAIAAFEKAHPEFSYVEDGAATAAMTPENGAGAGDAASLVSAPDEAKDGQPSRPKLAEWLQEERDAAPAPEVPPPAPAPFWVPREAEPELAPIPFGADDSGSRRPSVESVEPMRSGFMRADEGPTQQIPLAADYAALGRPGGPLRDRDEDEDDDTSPRVPVEEHTAEIPIMAAVPPPPAPSTPPMTGVRRPEEVRPVPAEIEELAQSTSIGQLKEMLSSVSRSEGGLSDDEIDRLATRVVERLSEKIVREIAWEVIPDVAELVIKQRIKELEAGAE
ncbi:MAG: response regulator [Thermoanaerobaculia bacterium]